jgi:hypothetical protein
VRLRDGVPKENVLVRWDGIEEELLDGTHTNCGRIFSRCSGSTCNIDDMWVGGWVGGCEWVSGWMGACDGVVDHGARHDLSC